MEAMLMHVDVIRDELQCYVCKRVLDDPQCLVCNHNFCRSCIESELRKTVSKCPRCSIPMRPGDVHRNQFLGGLVAEWLLVEAALTAVRPSGAKRKLSIDAVTPTKTRPSPAAHDIPETDRDESFEPESPELYPMMPPPVPSPAGLAPASPPLNNSSRQSSPAANNAPPESAMTVATPTVEDAPPESALTVATPIKENLTPLLTTPELHGYMARLQRLGQDIDDDNFESSSSSVAAELNFASQSSPALAYAQPSPVEIASPHRSNGIAMPPAHGVALVQPKASALAPAPQLSPATPTPPSPSQDHIALQRQQSSGDVSQDSAQPTSPPMPSSPAAPSSPPPVQAQPSPQPIPYAGVKKILVPKSPPTQRPPPVPSRILHATLVPSTQTVEALHRDDADDAADDADDVDDDDEDAVDETERPPMDPFEETQVPVLVASQSQLPSSPVAVARRLVCSDLTVAEQRKLLSAVELLGQARFGRDFAPCIDPRSGQAMMDVTHVITKAMNDRRCARTAKYMLGLAYRCWIVDYTHEDRWLHGAYGTYRWVEASMAAGYWVAEEPFEVDGDVFAADKAMPRKCREATATAKLFDKMRLIQLCPTTAFEPNALTYLPDVVAAFGGVYEPFVFAQALDDEPGLKTIGIVSKSLSAATCKELWQQHGIPIVRVTWVPDSVSHMMALPFDDYYPY
ncbi:hypothetical protein ACHHYP_03422 [Achlya hypogyna]|uniref:RING-type domain-containing protein n=1 Tax=Achlya hypogyna TaxID=1202772 RepID=A0A1V9ZRC8_ACHHY|nr:hypothetical protein ACHHYP_03422 [Achlya hypogyna]